jgi:phosphoribosylanthranilate isomerase
MNTPRIKICGLTQKEDIALCEELEVDYIGLIFAPNSKRFLTIEKAQELRSCIQKTKVVGIFVDETISKVQEIAEKLSLDFVQLHGSENQNYIRRLGLPVIKAFRTVPEAELIKEYLETAVHVMLDGRENGIQSDWEAVATLPSDLRHRLFIAGGLNPANVPELIRVAEPYAVDSASGVEKSPGIKDHQLLRLFVDAVRSHSSVSHA